MENVHKLYQISEIRRLENLAIQQFAISEAELMQRAGEAAYVELRKHWPQANKLLVVCGKGNNGGDGYVLAKTAKEHGLNVMLRHLGDLPKRESTAGQAYAACAQSDVDIDVFTSTETWNADVIVDAIFGIGIEKEITGVYQEAIQKINANGNPVLAIDVPSGLNADTGNVFGIAVRASLTITFIALKCGLFTGHGPAYCGEIVCHKLGISKQLLQQSKARAFIIPKSRIDEYLTPRKRDAHKGEFGHVLVVGGYLGMAGAARLAAEAALRVGAGLVSVATLPEHINVVTGSRPEIMSHGIKSGAELIPLIEKASVLVVGPGLGKASWGRELLSQVLQSDKTKILDADALNILSEQPRQCDDWILTPHSGEASRLLSTTVSDVENDRFIAVEKLQQKYRGICVLKGCGTLIKGGYREIALCDAGNPGMASAGMGDVLSGVLGGLVAQKLPPEYAVEIGVLLHALAGDQNASQWGERGMLASDLMLELRHLLN